MNISVSDALGMSGSMHEFGLGFGFIIVVVFIIIIVTVWVAVARSAFIQNDSEDDMERPSRVGQLYGYTVCLVAVLTGLTSVGRVINDVATLASPGATLQADYTQASLTSFEAYRATLGRERRFQAMPGAPAPQADTLPTVELRTRYEALRADRLTYERNEAIRSLISSSLMLLLAVMLFVVHWRWLGQTARGATVKARAATD
jgi:hypothetical protein